MDFNCMYLSLLVTIWSFQSGAVFPPAVDPGTDRHKLISKLSYSDDFGIVCQHWEEKFHFDKKLFLQRLIANTAISTICHSGSGSVVADHMSEARDRTRCAQMQNVHWLCRTACLAQCMFWVAKWRFEHSSAPPAFRRPLLRYNSLYD